MTTEGEQSINQRELQEGDFHIFVPSSSAFIVECKGQAVLNYQELQEEASVAVEPLIRERWALYWRSTAIRAAQHLANEKIGNGETLNDLMHSPFPLRPGMYYPCPPELAAKAVVS